MSCDCNSGGGDAYNNFCNADIPYPSVSHESVPSMMDNLTLALYGIIQKDVSSGKVKWIIPCDPTNSATVFGITRNANEGLMCYFIRAFQDTQAVTFIPAGQYGQILSSAGTNYLAWVTPAAGNVPGALVQRDSSGNFSASVVSANLNGSLQGGFPGSLVYQSDSTHTAYLSVGSLNQVLLSNGTLPTWATLAGSAYVDTTNASNISSGTLPAGRLPAFSGEVTSSIGSAVLALTPTGVSAGAYNVIQSGVARVPQVTVDSKGRLSNVTMVALAASAVTDTTNATNISSGTLAAGRLPASGATAATYGATTPQFLTVTVDTYGRITAISKQSDYVAYTLPTATASVLGGVKIGSNLTITGGVLSADATPLPIATASVLGGIKVGSNLTINAVSGVLSADATPLPIATASVLGGIKVGSNLTINAVSGVLSANATPLLPATTSALGGVIVGNGLSVSGTGLLSVLTGPGTIVTTFTGNGSTLIFGTLNGFISTDPQGYIVSVGGIDQRPTTDFTIQAVLATGNIVFATAPPAGATILVRSIKAASSQNATQLQGNPISSTTPIGDQYLGWDVGTNTWAPREVATGDVTGLTAALDGKTPTTRTITAGTGLTGGGNLTADRTLAVSYGTTSGTAAQGNDSRLSDSRTPTAHASTHQSGGSDQITSLALTTGTVSTAPGASTDIVNKLYADSIASGVNFHDACDYGTIAALVPAANYNQPGGAGVGVLATLTGALNTALQVDGVTVAVGKRILVKNQASSIQNGIYNVTRQGDGTTLPYILTRAADYDTSGTGTNEVAAGDFILVLGGTIANTAWVQQTAAPIVFGTSNISFIQFAAASGGVTSFSGGTTGLTPSSATTGAVSLAGTLTVANGGTGAITLTGLVKGTGTTAMIAATAGTDYVVPSGSITGNAATATTAAGLSATLAVGSGGTGLATTPANGQIDIGNGTGFTRATLTAGSNISITNTAGAISIASTATPVSSILFNRIINGAMVIDQRNNGAAVTPATTSAYTLDRWQIQGSVVSKLTVQQSSDAPAGFNNSLKVTVATQYSPFANEYFGLCSTIEGFDIYDLAFGSASASSITFSAWVKTSSVGIYSFRLINSSGLAAYVGLYTISTANTWTYVSVVIPGSTIGTWLTNNGSGIQIWFDLGSGSGGVTATPSTWITAGKVRTSTSSNFVSQVSGSSWQITGVQIEKGATATSFNARPYGTELALCQRYCRPVGWAVGQAVATTVAYFPCFGVVMRTTPTLSSASGFQITSATAVLLSGASATVSGASGDGAYIIGITVASGLVPGNASYNSPQGQLFLAEL